MALPFRIIIARFRQKFISSLKNASAICQNLELTGPNLGEILKIDKIRFKLILNFFAKI